MNTEKRPLRRPLVFLLILFLPLLAACTGQLANESWPGLAAAGDTVYVAYGESVLAYDVAAQSQKWTFPEESRAPFFAAPSVVDNQLVIGDFGVTGGFFNPQSIITIYGLEDEGNGMPRELWANNELATDRIVAQPLQVGNTVYVGTTDNLLFALDVEDGSELWRFEAGHSIWAQPTYHEGVLYVASLDRSLYAVEAESGAELWRTSLTGALSGKPIIGNDLIYVSSFDSELHALDMATGDEVWSAQAEDWLWASPALADGVLYFADSRGNIYAVNAATGEQLWQRTGPGAVQTSPVVVDDILYIASQGDLELEQGILAAYFISDGEEVWRQMTPAPLYTTPVVVDDTLVVALQSEEALLIGYNLQTGGQKWLLLPPSS